MNEILAMLSFPVMQRALIAAFMVGLAAPVVGIYLVQRRLSLLGDGIGHVALTGVAIGWLMGNWFQLVPNDVLAVPGAVVASLIAAVVIELIRERGRTGGDLALAIMFYGGIAGGVLIIAIAGGTSANLMAYLFGSISTVAVSDLIVIAVLCAAIVGIGIGLRHALFAVSFDEDFARASGLPVRWLNILLAAVAAATVTTAMRVVGLLLVSALMIVPVAIAQLVNHSFARTMAVASGIGLFVSLTGLIITYWYNVPPGATIVVLAIVIYAIMAGIYPLLRRKLGHAGRT